MPWLTLVISTLLSVETGGLSVQLMENTAGSSVQVPSKYNCIEEFMDMKAANKLVLHIKSFHLYSIVVYLYRHCAE